MAASALSICVSDGEDVELIHQLHEKMLSTETENRMAEIFKALSDPTRLRIVSTLVEHELCVHTLTELLGISQSAVSHQLRLMRQLHLVRFRKEGRHVYYTLDDDHVRDLFQQGLLHAEHR